MAIPPEERYIHHYLSLITDRYFLTNDPEAAYHMARQLNPNVYSFQQWRDLPTRTYVKMLLGEEKNK